MAEAIAAVLVAAESGALVTAGFVIGGNAAIINAALVVAASTAYSSVNARNARRRARDAYNAGLKDREVMVRTGVAPQRIIYGRDRVSGPVVYVESTGTRKEYLHLVVALAGHECDAVETVYLNDVALPAPDGSGNITSGTFAITTASAQYYEATASGTSITLPAAATRVTGVATVVGSGIEAQSSPYSGYTHTPNTATVGGLVSGDRYGINYETSSTESLVRVKTYLGTSTQTADADLVAESAGKWTTAHRGRGICYLYIRLKYHQDVFGSIGVPNISAVVRGKKVYDSRTTLTAWSNNAALCVADFLRDSTWGLGATAAQVPASELTTAANLCDELVDVDASTTQARYTFDGSFTADLSALDILRGLSTAMAGAAVWTQGRWLVRPGAYRTPLLTITEDHLADGAVVTVPKVSRSELFNAVRARHRDPDREYVEVQAPIVANATYTTEDGGRQIVRDLTLPFACEPVRAQRIARIEMERARQALTVRLRCNLKAYDLAPTDTVLLTLARYGWSAKAFEVIERTWAGAQLEYTLRETAAAVFDWNYGYAYTYDVAPDTALPNPYSPPDALTGLDVDSDAGMAVRLSSGAAVSRAYVTWTQSTDQFVVQGGRIDLEWKKARDTVWQSQRVPGADTAAWLLGVPNGDGILVRARAVTAVGRGGPWAYVSHTVNGIGAVPAFGQFLETFSTGFDAWRDYVGGAERSIVDISDGEQGGRALRIGNNSGNDMAWMIHDSNIPYDSGALYRVRARVRRTAGSGTVYVGVAGVRADGVTLCNTIGGDSHAPQHYVAASGAAPGSSWTLYEGYFSGYAATGTTTAAADPAHPGALHTDVRYVRPLVLVNYDGVAGITEVDYFKIERVEDWYDALTTAEAAQATADGKIITFWQTSAPGSASEGDIWFDTDDGSKQYRWTSGAWVVAADTRIGTAISNAATAQATADGKVVTFVQTSTPTAEGVGDLWFDSDAGYKLFRWNGSAWVAYTYGAGALTDGAATSVHVATSAGPLSDSTSIAPLSFVTDADARIVVTATGTMSVTNSTGSAKFKKASLSLWATSGLSPLTTSIDAQYIAGNVANGEEQSVPVTCQYTFMSVAAGTSVALSVRFSNHVASTIDQAVSNVTLRAEVIKR